MEFLPLPCYCSTPNQLSGIKPAQRSPASIPLSAQVRQIHHQDSCHFSGGGEIWPFHHCLLTRKNGYSQLIQEDSIGCAQMQEQTNKNRGMNVIQTPSVTDAYMLTNGTWQNGRWCNIPPFWEVQYLRLPCMRMCDSVGKEYGIQKPIIP